MRLIEKLWAWLGDRWFRDVPDPAPIMVPKVLYDFEICPELDDLKACISQININGCQIVSVTQDRIGCYTVFFRSITYA